MLKIDIKQPLYTVEGRALLDVDVELERGDIVCVKGPSGIGKSTLLRIIAGIIKPQQGSVSFDSKSWCDTESGLFVPANVRRTGLMFQDFALFPNMSVFEQVAYAQAEKNRAEVEKLLEGFELSALADRRPHQLSGGQKQRVALARAIASKPTMLLLDEPFSALDWELKSSMMETIRYAHSLLGSTTLLVCHDPADIKAMATSILHFRYSTLHTGMISTNKWGWKNLLKNNIKKNTNYNSLITCELERI